MILTRRRTLAIGGGLLATLAAPRLALARDRETIEMRGTARGEHVWFAPYGLAVAPGTVVRFVNLDAGNSHTATTYHPAILDRPLRIPQGAEPWDSDYLLPDESFEVTLTVPGVYDYYCQPHEFAGMVGRIVVGSPDSPGWQPASDEVGDIPEEALAMFPPVEAILRAGRIFPEDAS
ncbi:MAG TPA: plastocyanin/azurin family copper-binding protein [Paracoccaceae bacterium]|nr:plastocyanin/azurin family copper-binding protein [Paracoccaceae bacterium]